GMGREFWFRSVFVAERSLRFAATVHETKVRSSQNRPEWHTASRTIPLHKQASACESKLFGLSVLEWRTSRCGCHRLQCGDRFVSCGKNGRDHRSSRERTAGRGTFGKQCVAERHFDFVQRDTGFFGCELCQDCVGAGADVLSAAGHAHCSVIAQLDTCL